MKRRVLLAAALVLLAPPALAAFPPVGVLSLGDSLTDPPTGRWPGILSAERGVRFGGPGNPLNLAASGATIATLLSGGQHTAARARIEAREADVAFLWIGGNDVRAPGFALAVAEGALAGAALETALDGFADGIAAAADEVLAGGPRGLVLSAVPDVTLTPGALALVPDPSKRAAVAAAIDGLNARLRAFAGTRGAVFLDDAALQREVQGAPLLVGGVTIAPGQGGATFLYADAIHPGVVGQAIVANARIAALNAAFGAGIAPLADLEILQIAGLGHLYAGETLSERLDYAGYLAFPARGIDLGCAQASPGARRVGAAALVLLPFALGESRRRGCQARRRAV